jgi:lactoylglutathione lyase
MPASMRIEIFPSDIQRCIDFYVDILQFKIRKHEGTYLFIQRGEIFIGAVEAPSSETAAAKAAYRKPTKGLEIVFEVDNLEAERDRILEKGWILDADIQMQEWGLRDFRLFDPDGYYLRVTTHSPNRDSKGGQKQ